MGLLEDLEKAAMFQAAIEASRKADGKPDPYAAAGIVMGLGQGYSLQDASILGAMLGSQGAFDDDKGDDDL